MPVRAQTNEFQLVINSTPIGSFPGVTITPGNNTYGTYVQLLSGAAVTADAYGFWINVNSNAVSGQARDSIAKVGIDPGGGTSYQDFVVDLTVAGAQAVSGGGTGIWFYFPARIRAGSSVALAVSVNNATVGTCSAQCRLMCKPTRPELLRVGSFVRTFGSTPASSSGTALTPGADAKGTYVQLGSALAEPLWYWCLGIGINQSVMSVNSMVFDLAIGDASNKRVVISDLLVASSTAETLSYTSSGAGGMAAVGDIVYARGGSRGGAVTGWSAVGYGVGG